MKYALSLSLPLWHITITPKGENDAIIEVRSSQAPDDAWDDWYITTYPVAYAAYQIALRGDWYPMEKEKRVVREGKLFIPGRAMWLGHPELIVNAHEAGRGKYYYR